MGNQKSQFQQRFSNNYAFIQTLQDPIYGLVKVYRKKFENYHYVMVIDRRLQEFNNHTFMTDCIRPGTNSISLQKKNRSTFAPTLFVKESQEALVKYNSLKLQKLKRTLELIKRYQDELMVPFFSYQIVGGKTFECSEPVIQLYVQFQNHRLFEYLEVLRSKSLSLKAKEIVYILKSVCQAISQLQKMQIQVTSKEINIHSIFTSNEGEIKFHPIEILTKKQHERQNLHNIEQLKEEYSNNPHAQMKKIGLGRNLRSTSSAVDKRSVNENSSGTNNLRDRNILFSSNESYTGQSLKVSNHKQILRKLLIQLSAYSLLKGSQNKDLQSLNTIISRSPSLNQIQSNLIKYASPCLEGLLVQRIYDFDQNAKNQQQSLVNNSKSNANREGLSTNGLSNGKSSLISQINHGSNNQPDQTNATTKTEQQKAAWTYKGVREKSNSNIPKHPPPSISQQTNERTNYKSNNDFYQSRTNEQSNSNISNPNNTFRAYTQQKALILRKDHNASDQASKYQAITQLSQLSQQPSSSFNQSSSLPNQVQPHNRNNNLMQRMLNESFETKGISLRSIHQNYAPPNHQGRGTINLSNNDINRKMALGQDVKTTGNNAQRLNLSVKRV